ncbi:major facilitator superfamily domain-containing protein [Radiomyces spectabilis]|uniref:major facilitator superfamily domain-containing protein n=1 Tax=Radiomyces spectabilis TaxID=64574 RepID=UPI00221FD715|nr:major facilitator superfamily domain-containing protein [Radiomyces spectabilis]KAI8384525.1 major facilitator superfamily domain-containing protein [Radiomyces spectabilis]
MKRSIHYGPVEEEPYSVFSLSKKRWIVTLASVAAFFSPFSINSYYPAMNQIQEELHVSSQEVNLSVTVYMIFQAITPSIWGSMADNQGRRPVYLLTLFIYILSNIALALSVNYPMLLIFRMLQAFGASSVVAIGAGTIADITVPEERGGYIGWFSLGFTLGPVLGPAIGGFISHLLGWRWIFWFLAIVCSAHWLLMVFTFPETLRSRVGNGTGYANPTPQQWWHHRKERKQREKQIQMQSIDSDAQSISDTASTHTMVDPEAHHSKWSWLMAPLRPLMYAKEKDALLLVIVNAFQYAAVYTVTSTLPYLFSRLYNMNDAIMGVSYLPNGFGSVCGSVLQGRLLNRHYRNMRKRTILQGIPDDEFPLEYTRLRTFWFYALVYNIAMIAYGWCLYVSAPLAVVLVIHFFFGFTSQAIFNSIQTLFVDLFPDNSATITACNNFFRCLFGALATVVILPVILALGPGWAYTVVSAILLVSRLLVFVVMRKSPGWRREREKRKAEDAAAKHDTSSPPSSPSQ